MKHTENLNLPIYDNPEVDVFDMQEWNSANQNIDFAYKQIIDIKDSMVEANPTAELIEARGGEKTLNVRVTKIETKANKAESDLVTANEKITEIKNSLTSIPVNGNTNKLQFKSGLKGSLPTLNVSEPMVCTDTKELYVGTNSGNLKLVSETELNALKTKHDNFEITTNNSLALKQPVTDNTLITNAKTVKGAINELKTETTDLKNKLTYVTTASPTLGAGLTIFDDTVENVMTLSMDGFVNYSFCVTGGKSNNNIAHGSVLCTIPSSIPVPKLTYGIAILETVAGVNRLAMTALNPTNRRITLYFIGDSTAVSSVRGTISWRASTP